MLNQLHRYLGISLALLLVITSISGALLLWADEYHQWRYPALQGHHDAPLMDPVALQASIDQAAGPVATIVLPSEGLPAFYLFHEDGSESFHNISTGAQIAHWQPLGSLYSFLFEVHAYLLSGETGHIVIGSTGLLLSVMLFSGIAIWWRRRKVFRLRRWRPKTVSAPVLLNAHAAQGVFISAIFVIIALTGAGMVFHDEAETLLKKLPGSVQKTRPVTLPVAGAKPSVHWTRVLESAEQTFPDGVLRVLYLPTGPGQPVQMRLKLPGEIHSNGRSYLSLHPQTGAVLDQIDATQTGSGPAIYNLFYPLHTGKTGWPGNRLLLFIVSLSSLYLAASGSWVHLRRRRRGKEKSGKPDKSSLQQSDLIKRA